MEASKEEREAEKEVEREGEREEEEREEEEEEVRESGKRREKMSRLDRVGPKIDGVECRAAEEMS